ncbi:hypothetical protein BDW59DRAFT_145029 [Aspergillus cavernicola]|uniref:Uncharacterized protein n=1 Tax=Aspergillus cavernicola TaxID=176166 RepID=A0ABR4IG13_9EURO
MILSTSSISLSGAAHKGSPRGSGRRLDEAQVFNNFLEVAREMGEENRRPIRTMLMAVSNLPFLRTSWALPLQVTRFRFHKIRALVVIIPFLDPA